MKKKNYTLNIKVITGMHIGIGSDRPEIGGIDNPFIKDTVSKLPYIPGSSLKGKLRCLLETESEKYKGEDDETIKRNFGGDDNSPTRLIFRDINLIDKFKKDFNSGKLQTEVKTEIKINRKTGTALGGELRTTERIPPDTEFEGEVLVRYNNDELNDIKQMLDEAVELLNNDYLGGSGSRGYGAVKVTLIEKKSEQNVEA